MKSGKSNIKLAIPDTCTGCAACANVCPKGCISMVEDKEGFLHPKVDNMACIECHRCEKTCPILNKETISGEFETKVYAVINPNEEIRMQSSSGGMFHSLAKWVIEQGGVVFGARWDEDWMVMHDYAEDIEGVKAFMKSKYVQSRVGDTYKQAKDFLKQDRWVLYSGTPCQLGGLRAYLGKEYEKLIQVDLICHGVPSPGVWRKYLKQVPNSSCISAINFRDKVQGWGLGYCMTTTTTTTTRQDYTENPYYTGFLSNILLRKCCAHCEYRKQHRATDITMADYWGVNETCKEMFDGKGTSAIFIHTSKGAQLLSKQKEICVKEQPVQIVVERNMHMIEDRPVPKRRKWFFMANRVLPFDKASYYIGHDPYMVRVKRKVKKLIKKLSHRLYVLFRFES